MYVYVYIYIYSVCVYVYMHIKYMAILYTLSSSLVIKASEALYKSKGQPSLVG